MIFIVRFYYIRDKRVKKRKEFEKKKHAEVFFFFLAKNISQEKQNAKTLKTSKKIKIKILIAVIKFGQSHLFYSRNISVAYPQRDDDLYLNLRIRYLKLVSLISDGKMRFYIKMLRIIWAEPVTNDKVLVSIETKKTEHQKESVHISKAYNAERRLRNINTHSAY